MKSKKLLSLAVAFAMVLALAIPAFAATVTTSTISGGTYATTLSGEFQNYKVDITIKGYNKVLVNPYKINFTPDGLEDPTDDQVIDVGTFIDNNTDVALKVTAKVTTTVGANVSLLDSVSEVNKTDAGTPMPKAAFIVFEILPTSDGETRPNWTKPQAVTSSMTSAAVLPSTSSGSPVVLTDCLSLAAVEPGEDHNYACFHVDGYLNVYPQKVSTSADSGGAFEDDPWTEADTISANVILTFTPKVNVSDLTFSGT